MKERFKRLPEALQKQVAAKFSNLDVNLINGGQPVYYYIISVE